MRRLSDFSFRYLIYFFLFQEFIFDELSGIQQIRAVSIFVIVGGIDLYWFVKATDNIPYTKSALKLIGAVSAVLWGGPAFLLSLGYPAFIYEYILSFNNYLIITIVISSLGAVSIGSLSLALKLYPKISKAPSVGKPDA